MTIDRLSPHEDEIFKESDLTAKNFEAPEKMDGDSLGMYLSEISQFELMTAEDERRLGWIIQQDLPDPSNQEEYSLALERQKAAKKEFTERNLRLVVYVAKMYPSDTIDMFDRIQQGNLGLGRAVEKYDPNKGFKFSTYAVWWIRQSIDRYVNEQGHNGFRVPSSAGEMLKNLYKAKEVVSAEDNTNSPSVVRLAQETGIDQALVSRLLTLSTTTSVDEAIPVSGSSFDQMNMQIEAVDGAGLSESTEDQAVKLVYEEELRNFIQSIILGSDEEKKELINEIVLASLGLIDGVPDTKKEIAKILNLTPPQLRKLELKGLDLIKNDLNFKRQYTDQIIKHRKGSDENNSR